MGDSWPWDATRRPLTGVKDCEIAIRFGLASDMTSAHGLTEMLCAGAPIELEIRPFWIEVKHHAELRVDHDECKIIVSFVQDKNNKLVIDFGRLEVSKRLQGLGYSIAILKNLLIICDTLQIGSIIAFANSAAGGYVWAKAAGLPFNLGAMRRRLLARLKRRKFADRFSSRDLDRLRRRVERSTGRRLMLNVASFRGLDGQHIGKELLLGFGWDAFWPVRLPSYRKLIAKALP